MPRPMRPPSRNDAYDGYGTAWSITATLLAGILAWGGIGYLADRLFDTGKLFLAIGMVLGICGSIYLVYLKYGREQPDG